jgi:hypothetical protein
VISRLENRYLQQIVDLLNPIADLASQGQLVANVSRLKDEYDETSSEDRKALLVKLMNAELSKLGEGSVQDTLRSSLAGSGAGVSKTAAAKASAPTSATSAPTKAEQVRAAVARFTGPFRAVDVKAACSGVSLVYVRQVLAALKKEGVVRCLGRGPAARWERK